MSDEIRATVAAILEHASVTYSAAYVGETKRDGWACDEWRCTFTKSLTPAHSDAQAFEFYTGLGRREDTPMTKLARIQLKGCSRNSIAWHKGVTKGLKPKAPHPADLLYSLIMDSSACDMSFDSWCGEYGYDTDSRKALATYEACQKNTDKLRRLFNRNDIEALRDALQEY